jgi:hypothetical protein
MSSKGVEDARINNSHVVCYPRGEPVIHSDLKLRKIFLSGNNTIQDHPLVTRSLLYRG